jgi:phenylalanyl-tRNA synthetase beta subunit
VLLESACFDPASIRRTAHRTELRSSVVPLRRGVDIEGVPSAADRAAALLKQLAATRSPENRRAYPAP